MANIHIYFDHFTPGFCYFLVFMAVGESRLNAVFRRKMWINLFSERLRKNKFDKANAMKRPVYGTSLRTTTIARFYYTPIMGLPILVVCSNLGFSIKKNEA
jgi:hypothetical protein